MSTLFFDRNNEAAYHAMVAAYNALHKATVATGSVHQDISGVPSGDYRVPSSSNLQVSAPNATDLASAVTLVNALRGAMGAHFGDTNAHAVAHNYTNGSSTIAFNVSGVTSSVAPATNLATAYTLLTFLSGAYGAHIGNTTYHQRADTRPLTGTLTAAQGDVNFM